MYVIRNGKEKTSKMKNMEKSKLRNVYMILKNSIQHKQGRQHSLLQWIFH